VLALVAGVTGCSGDDSSGGGGGGAGTEAEVVTLPRLHAVRGERPGVFDEDGRQVVLRGVNLNGLAEYARANEDLDPTVPVTDETWDQIADEGFNVVRLLVSWSRLEPERGEIDDDYVDEIRSQARAAGERGIYTIIDMHQDAWGPFVATPAGASCPAGSEPSNGWDGAPEWATPDPAEVDSCRPADGEAKPGSDLVVEAWDRFYRDANGIQSQLVDVWEHLAGSLADEPSVAGYDLLNEPGHGEGPTAPEGGVLSEFPALGDYYARAIEAIRQGEDAAGIDPRPIYFEHSVAGNPPPVDFSDDPGLVFSPHIYGGSIVTFLTVDQNWDVMLSLAAGWETSIWVGEYGWWDDPADRPEIVERVEQFAAREDSAAPGFVPVGSAWWQWVNGCGDPHQITDAGMEAPAEIRQYRITRCVDGSAQDDGVVPAWHEVLTRPTVRFAPGWITSVAADPFQLTASGATSGTELDLWIPADQDPTLTGTGNAQVEATQAGTGWTLTATACTPTYEVTVGANGPSPPDACP
jgi:endoglycosylceramidase